MNARGPKYKVGRLRWWYAMRGWERVLLVAILGVTLAVSVALMYYGPSLETTSRAAPPKSAVAATTTPALMYPPGTRWYLRRGQWFPPSEPLP